MATPLPSLTDGPVNLGQLREEARRLLVEALDTRRGKKVLVLDPKVSGFLGLLAEVALLKEHGVEQLLHLSSAPLRDLGVRGVVYLVRASIKNVQLIAKQIKATNQERTGLEYSVFFLPRRTIACERVLQEEGVYGDITAGEFPVDLIPLDADVASLELDGAFAELLGDGDRSSLFACARALHRFQQRYGLVGRVKGKGPAAAAVWAMLARMRREASPETAPAPGGVVGEMVLLDREVDGVTPLCTQLTYEGLLDETLQIRNGFVTYEPTPGGPKQKVAVNSADRVFAELRDCSFGAVGPRLGERAKAIQQDYRGSKERSMAELKDFAQQLKALPAIQRHISLAEAVNRACAGPAFRARVQAEQALLDGHSIDAAIECIEDLMATERDPFPVLRLICLLSITQGGLPKKHADLLRRGFLQAYGHAHILTLQKLTTARLLRRQDGSKKGTFGAVKRAFRLLVEDVGERDPTDSAYILSGFASLLVRLVEGAVSGPGWDVSGDSLRLLPGPALELLQTVSEEGLPVDTPVPQPPPSGRPSSAPSTSAAVPVVTGRRRVIAVVFIGGATLAEINALRWLSRRPGADYTFLIIATQILNGNTLLKGFVEDSVAQAAQLEAAV